MPHTIGRASTGRAKCRACGQTIVKGALRLGARVPNPFADAEGAETTLWFHLLCAAYSIQSRWSRRWLRRLRRSRTGRTSKPRRQSGWRISEPRAWMPASRAPSGRAACRACKQPIGKGTWRIGLVFYEDGRFAPSGYIHVACAADDLETPEVMARLRHFSPGLSEAELAEIAAGISSR